MVIGAAPARTSPQNLKILAGKKTGLLLSRCSLRQSPTITGIDGEGIHPTDIIVLFNGGVISAWVAQRAVSHY